MTLTTLSYRNDNFEEAVGSSMDIGATILKVGLGKVLVYQG
jgi:hypothetical protein